MPDKSFRNKSYLSALVLCAASLSNAFAATPATPTPANSYLVHNLVSDLPSMADYEDPNLVNPWGLATTAAAPSGSVITAPERPPLYGTTGAPVALVVTIPTPTASTGGAVSGVIANTTTSFPVATGKNASFIFCTEDGTVSGWNSSVNATGAVVTVNNSSSNAVFKGCAIGGTSAAPVIYVTDFHNGVVDMFDANFNPIAATAGAFTDSARSLPDSRPSTS